jgi:hypothetical protein
LVPHVQLSLDDHLERFCLGGMPERVVGIENFIELKAMRD